MGPSPATSMARPSTVPTAEPVSIPPFMAEAITSSSASTLPMATVSNSTTREKAISAQEAMIIRDTVCRSSAASEFFSPPLSASRKKKLPPKASVTSSISSAAAGTAPARTEKPPRKPVMPITSPAAVGINQGLLLAGSSWKTKATVYTSTEAAM